MQRYGSMIKLKPEKLDEYKALQANAWAEVFKMIREKLELGEKRFELDLKGNEEIKSVHVKYNGSATEGR